MDFVSIIEEIAAAGLTSFLRSMLEVYGPRMFWALTVLFAGWMLGRVLAWLVERMARRGGFSVVFKRTSIGRAILVSGYTPAQFFGSVTKFCIYIVAVYIAVEVLAIQTLCTLMREVVFQLPEFISGLLIFVVGSIFSDAVGNIARQAGGGSGKTEYHNPFGDIIRIFLYFVTLVMALTQMGVDVTILYIFAQAFAWSTALAVAIAFGWHLKDRIGPWIEQIFPQPKRTRKRRDSV